MDPMLGQIHRLPPILDDQSWRRYQRQVHPLPPPYDDFDVTSSSESSGSDESEEVSSLSSDCEEGLAVVSSLRANSAMGNAGVPTRYRQRALDEFFCPLNKHVKRNEELGANANNRFVNLPRDILEHWIIPCLGVSGLTNLAHMCRTAAFVVHRAWGPVPYVVRQEMSPLKLAHDFDWEDYQKENDSPEINIAWSVRRFHFLLNMQHHGIMQVEVRLRRQLWWEYLHGTDAAFPIQNSLDRWIETRVYRQVRMKAPHGGSVTKRIKCFETYGAAIQNDIGYWLEDFDRGGSDLDSCALFDPHDEDEYTSIENMVPAVEHKLRGALACIWVCCKRIASSPSGTYNFPSFEYLIMHGVPDKLFQCLPEDFKSKHTDKSGCRDRNPIREWKFRPPSLETEGFSFFNQTCLDYDGCEIHQIPWYRYWYPKPVVLNQSNLLASLPRDILEGVVLSYLPSEDAAVVLSLIKGRTG